MSEAEDSANSLEAVLGRARRATDVAELQQDRAFRSQLESLGLAAHVDFLRVIVRSRDRTFFAADLDTLGIVARDRALCRKLSGSGLDEAVLDLLSRPALRARVTKRFLQELDQHSSQAHLVWHLADALEAALDRELISVRRFASMREYLRLGLRAQKLVRSEAYRYPTGPFPLGKGWRWFESGADFALMAGYDADHCLHWPEEHHRWVVSGDLYLLRDAVGAAWMLKRLPL